MSHEANSSLQLFRACSYYAVSHSKTFVISINKEKYRRAVEASRNRIKSEKIEFLKSVEMFSLFQRNSLKNLSKYLTKRKMHRSQVLYKEGQQVNSVYFVIDGEFKVTKKIMLIDKKQEQNQTQLESVQNVGIQRPNSTAYPKMKRRENK